MVVADRLLRIRIPIPQSARQLLTCQDRWLKKPDRISRIKTPNGYSTGFKKRTFAPQKEGGMAVSAVWRLVYTCSRTLASGAKEGNAAHKRECLLGAGLFVQ